MVTNMYDKEMSIIRKHCADHAFRYTQHFMQRIIQRRITLDDVAYALSDGEIIEYYPDDYPFPSCLVLGCTMNNLPLHIVCGIAPDELFLITAYQPDPAMWAADFRTRKALERKE